MQNSKNSPDEVGDGGRERERERERAEERGGEWRSVSGWGGARNAADASKELDPVKYFVGCWTDAAGRTD